MSTQIVQPQPVRPLYSRFLNPTKVAQPRRNSYFDFSVSEPELSSILRRHGEAEEEADTTQEHEGTSFECFCEPSRTNSPSSSSCHLCMPYPPSLSPSSSASPSSPLSPAFSTFSNVETEDPSILSEFYSIFDAHSSPPSSRATPAHTRGSTPLLGTTKDEGSQGKTKREGKMRKWLTSSLGGSSSQNGLAPSRTQTRNPFSRVAG
ncbi:hypothetical protein JCM5353_008480 [Sporobolomyces roseus]